MYVERESNAKRKELFERMKRASSKHRAAKRERIKAKWWKWVDRQVWR